MGDELSKRDAADLGVADMTGPQLRARVLRLEGWLAEAMLTLDEILVGIGRGELPALAVQRALEITAEVRGHWNDREEPKGPVPYRCEFCGDERCTFHAPKCRMHQERIARAIRNGMPPSGRHG